MTTPHQTDEAFAELERSVHAALETYSNVHRGSGHNSMVSTHLFEQARGIVLEHLGLDPSAYMVVFCTPRRAAALAKRLPPECHYVVSSRDLGLSFGVRALAIKKTAAPRGVPFESGGGTTKLVSKEWVIWADAPDKLEAGTPAIVNIIAFARALRLVQTAGRELFMGSPAGRLTPDAILRRDELEAYSGRALLAELRRTLIGRGACVPTREGPKPFINLDNGASTPTFGPIWDAFRRTCRQPDDAQQEIVREVKSVCAEALRAPTTVYDVLFTSSTTEAINLAAESLGREPQESVEPVVLTTLLEHSSNDLPWRTVPGHSLVRLSVDREGFVDLNELERALDDYNHEGRHGKKRITLVAVSGASNVLGTCNDLAAIGQLVHRHGARLLVDAAQLVAHRQVDMERWDLDYLALSAHKVYAPFGCGVLVVRKGLLRFDPVELEAIRASGEENAGGIAALGKALVLLQRIGMELIEGEERALTARVLNGLATVPGLTVYGVKDPASPRFAQRLGVVAFNLKSPMPKRVADELAVRGGIGVRHGCHCAHLLIKHLLDVGPSLERFQRVIQTLFPRLRLPGMVRVSLGVENDTHDVDELIATLTAMAEKRSGKALLSRGQVRQQMTELAAASARRVYSPPSTEWIGLRAPLSTPLERRLCP